eukprot:3732788-Amphidinium_carterae.1
MSENSHYTVTEPFRKCSAWNATVVWCTCGLTEDAEQSAAGKALEGAPEGVPTQAQVAVAVNYKGQRHIIVD